MYCKAHRKDVQRCMDRRFAVSSLVYLSDEMRYHTLTYSVGSIRTLEPVERSSPSPPGECVPPPLLRGEDRLAGQRGGWGVNILEDERNRIALLQ
jgi:hypothetical protein